MNRSIVLPALVTAFVALSPVGVAVAAPNPSGTGQPNQQAPENSVPGFASPGFAKAETLYANPDSTGGSNSGNLHVVSQYDVAGFQYCQHHSCS